MIASEAAAIVASVLNPFGYDRFFDEVVGRRPLKLIGDASPDRAKMLGADPAATILAAYETHAARLTCHSHRPSAPPPTPGPVAGAAGFENLIRSYHARGYTVRVPDVAALSASLARFMRALELLIGKPADAALFWSAPNAAAPVHYDDYDIIVVQLSGSKEWFVSTEPPGLNNQWKVAAETPPQLRDPDRFEVGPGDLVYLPRGTPHTVRSVSESLHLSVGFVPVTVRDAIIAALDHMSETDREFRQGLTIRADDPAARGEREAPTDAVRRGVERLLARCGEGGFLAQALGRRSSRMVGDLPKLAANDVPPSVPSSTTVRHSPLAIVKLITTPELVDFAQPGSHVLVHRGVEEALRFIAATPSFRVGDIPGPFGDDIRAALTGRLLASGFLELV